MCRRFVAVFFIWLGIFGNVYSQERHVSSPWTFTHLGVEEGLASSNVMTVTQDTQGFWWLGTDNGLQRFDGKNFRTYRHVPGDSTSLPGNSVSKLWTDRGGKIWIACNGTSIAWYDPAFDCFRKTPCINTELLIGYPTQFFEDSRNNLWLLTSYKGGLYRYIPQKKGWEKLDAAKDFEFKGRDIQEDTNTGNIYLLIGNDVAYLEPKTGIIKWFQTPIQKQGLSPEGFITWSFKIDRRNGTIWRNVSHIDLIGTYLFSHHLITGKKVKEFYTVHAPNYLFQSENGIIWQFFEKYKQIQTFDTKKQKLTYLHSNPEDSEFPLLEEYGFRSVYEDREHNIWLASNSGIYIFSPTNQRFKNTQNLYHENGIFKKLSTNSNFYQASNGDIWVGTYFEGLFVFDASLNFKRSYFYPKSPEGTPDTLQNYNFNAVWAIAEDKMGRIWAGGQLGTLQMYSKEGSLIRQWRPLELDKRTITKLVPDKSGNIWIARNKGHLASIGSDNLSVEVFPIPRYDSTRSIIEDFYLDQTSNCIWIALYEGGMLRFDMVRKQYEPVPTVDILGKPITSIKVAGIKPWKKYKLLVYGDFLYELDTRTFTLIQLNSKSGPPLREIRLLQQDKNGKLWVGTKEGLIMWNSKDGHAISYGYRDGIADREFNYSNLSHPLQDGGILASTGRKGFFYFHPDSFYNAQAPPNVIIDAIKVRNRQLAVPTAGATIVLPYNENTLEVRYVCLSWLQQPHIRFRYRISGNSDEWTEHGAARELLLTGLSPGTYHLEIQAVNREGLTSPEITTLEFRIRPPWWGSPVAWIIYLALLSWIGYRWYRFQLLRKLEKAEARRLRELDTFKSDFYQNITHEFRTPLTVITGIADTMMENAASVSRDNLDRIRRNGHRLLDMVNQMLDLSKMESGRMVLHYQCGDVIPLLKIIFESIHSWAASRQINCNLSLSEAEIIMDHDPEKFQQVVINLLSNAVKFSPEGGNIHLSTRLVEENDFSNMHFHFPPSQEARKWLRLEVEDTGVGISEEHLPHIFNRFFQVEYHLSRRAEGTGIGLALVAELVRLMGGGIAVRSKPGQGSTFAVVLPVSQKAPMVESPVPAYVMPWKRGSSEAVLEEDIRVGAETVLIVEDNADMARYIAICLEDKYRLLHASNGAEGLEIASREVPDLVLSDVMMPGMDGLELCARLKSEESTSHIPVILLTARAGQEHKLEGLRRGAEEYLVKPFHREELLLRIEGLLEVRRRMQERYRQLAGIESGSGAIFDTTTEIPEEDAFLRKVREIVDTRLGDPGLSVGMLCREVFLGASQFNRKLSALTGYTAVQYIRRRRMERARVMLRETTLGVAEIAATVGYEDPSFFTRSFRQDTGMSPSQWRERGE